MVNRNSPRNNQSRQILLQTECTVAFSQDGRDSIPVRVLLDSGSSNNPSMTHLIIAKENPWLMNNPYHEDESKALTYQLGKFWEVESIGIQNDDSLTANKEFLREIRYNDSENRYEVNLPWKSGQIPRSNGYISCVNRLRQLHRNLKGNEELLCECEITNLSINECLETGPNVVPHLFDDVIKFRGYPIAMIADVEKAFHQVLIAPEDRRMMRFLWFDDVNKDNPEIVKYQFCRLPFGLTSSPAILSSVLQHHFNKQQEQAPEVVSLLQESFYVDDLATGASTDEEANRIYEQSSELMNRGGFRLRNWHTNSEALRAKINVTVNNPENVVNAETVSGKPGDVVESATPGSKHEPEENLESPVNSVKVLGVSWNVKTDTLHQEHSDLVKYAETLPSTKRSVLKLSCLRRFSI
jgi:hypothetical protein